MCAIVTTKSHTGRCGQSSKAGGRFRARRKRRRRRCRSRVRARRGIGRGRRQASSARKAFANYSAIAINLCALRGPNGKSFSINAPPYKGNYKGKAGVERVTAADRPLWVRFLRGYVAARTRIELEATPRLTGHHRARERTRDDADPTKNATKRPILTSVALGISQTRPAARR